jgi:surfeit locus 1 family protein
MYRFVLRPRWIVGHVVVVSVVILFVVLGLWQLSRLEQRIAQNQLVEARREYPVVDLSRALNEVPPGGEAEDVLAYRRVVVAGTYDVERELLIRSRTLNGQPGFYVVTPLVWAEGAILVNRGFVPQQFNRAPVEAARPPGGAVEVEGRVRASVQPPRIGPKDPPDGVLQQVFWLNIARIQQQMPYDLVPVSLELASQSPPQRQPLPVPLPDPVLSEGPHRGYALQWFSFAIIGIVGYGFLIRRAGQRPGEA